MGLSMRVNEPWAKTSPTGEICSLIAHCRHVAVMARQLMASRMIRQRLNVAFETELTDTHLDRLAVLAGLHDLGKALKGFQDKLEDTPLTSRGHVVEALAVLANSAQAREAIGLLILSEWFERTTDALYVAICHHGEPIGDERIRPHIAVVDQLLARTRYGHEPIVEIRRLRDMITSHFPLAAQSVPRLRFTPAAQHLFAGILMAADWMASGFAFTPGAPEALASDVLDRTVWTGWHSGAPAQDLLEGREPRPAQLGTLELPLDERLVILEAPTGSGKTEAALIWASRLVEAGHIDGLYFAVPTRSAATELHARIGRLMSTMHPALKGKIVRALPGLLDTDNSVPDYPAETWAVAAPKRTFAAPIAVGTIDQALLSIVRAQHAWMRAAFLARHLLVVDEVHASDPYMAGLTRGLVERHLALGGRALAMSATLGETARAILMGDTRRGFNEAIAAAAFETSGVPALLHHSRYAIEDRTWLDGRLLEIFGLNGARRGIVAVTTQTAEQSLDIDADLLITDACPADVFLQRLGRLHRHRTGTRPLAILIDPGPLDRYLLPDGKVFGRPGQGWPWVYRNLLSVSSTLDWVRASGSVVVPDDCRQLVERATHADHLRQRARLLGSSWENLWGRLFDDAAMQAQLAEANLVDWTRPYRDALVNEWLPTRLGDGTVAVAVVNLNSPFTNEALEGVPVPGRWLGGVPLPDSPINASEGRLRVGSIDLAYDRFGVQRIAPA
jgi:CRISPR-associated endonuclease Cas3-HD